eukprot:PhM_4_TR8769/c0_g1_i1/m.36995
MTSKDEDVESNISQWKRHYDRKLLDLEFHFSAGPLRVVPIDRHWGLLRRKTTPCVPRPNGQPPWLRMEQVCRREYDATRKDMSHRLKEQQMLKAVLEKQKLEQEEQSKQEQQEGSSTTGSPLCKKSQKSMSLTQLIAEAMSDNGGSLAGRSPRAVTPFDQRASNIYAKRRGLPVDREASSDFTATTALSGASASRKSNVCPVGSASNAVQSASAYPKSKSCSSSRPPSARSAVSDRLGLLQHELALERQQRTNMEKELNLVSKQLALLRSTLKFDA